VYSFCALKLLLCCSAGITRWVQKKTGPAAATLADKDALAAAEKGAEVLVLGYFKDFKVRQRLVLVQLLFWAAGCSCMGVCWCWAFAVFAARSLRQGHLKSHL
jgi:hypothetical protein